MAWRGLVLLLLAPMLIVLFGVAPCLVKRNAALDALSQPQTDRLYGTAIETLHTQRTVAALGLELEGHHHSGIDDCRNLANVARAMLQLGWKVDVTGQREE